jgi:RHS repeat-associated protein
VTKTFTVRVVLFVVLASSLPIAQVAIGTPQFGSFGGGPFDTVNLGNLNVHFTVPILHKSGRGMSFAYNVSYDSSIWQPVTSNGTTSWTNMTDTTWGWTFSMPRGGHGSYKFLSQSTGYCYNGHIISGTQITYTYANWAYYDGFGTPHPFAGTSFVSSGCYGNSSGGFTGTSSDNSGYTMTVNGTAVTSLTARDGTKINPSSGTTSLQDANGNQITSATLSGTTTYTDTLGTTALTISGNGTASSPIVLGYTAPAGSASYTVNYTQYTIATNFGVSGITEYGPLANPLISSIQLQDGSQYRFTYEKTPGSSCTPLSGTYLANCITGRIASVTLPTGGTIGYTYTGGNNGIFSDGSTAGITRLLTPGGTWTYLRNDVSGTHWQTTITDPSTNQTVIDFQQDSATSAPTQNFYETQRNVYQGSTSADNCSPSNPNNCLLLTTTRCYNANYANCTTTTVSSPFTQTDYYTQPAGGQTRLSQTLYNPNGLVSDDKEYDYGATTGSAPGTTHLVRETSTTYASLGNGIVNQPASVIVYDWTSGSGLKLASSTYVYDNGTQTGGTVTATSGTPQHASISGSRGNLTSTTVSTGASSSLTKSFSYYDTGAPNVVTDVNGAQATYVYGSVTNPYNTLFTASCGNSFATTISEPLSLSRSMQWDCTGGMAKQVTDENGNNVSSNYTDPDFWRPFSVTDQMSNQSNITYVGQTAVEAALQNFNGGNSASDSRTTIDGFGRPTFSQRLQAPGSTNYDTLETDYNNLGQPYRSTMPYTAQASPSSSNTTAPATTRTYDALGRTLTVTDADGGTVSYTYTNNDVLQTVSGGQNFEKQFEYDGLGRLTSVCEVNVSGKLSNTGTCGQGTTQNGYWTKYTYDALGRLLTVTQNAQSTTTTPQKRTFTYDMLGRMSTESNPETGKSGVNGTITYTYDGGCSTTPLACGNLTSKLDAAGNTTNYTYDALHRMLTAGNSGISGATLRAFVYDSKSSYPTGVSVVNAKTRMVEATTTTTSGTPITDEFFSYDKRGELTDVYELTPHSSGYYHTTAAYWPTGTLETLGGIPGVPTINYGANGAGLDGEGRITEITASSGTNPVTGVTYSTSSTTNPLGSLTKVTFGSADSDSFTYDPNTGRMATYLFSVNSKTDAGTLTWNPNGTLNKLVINDQIPGTADSQTCTYGYDDLQRVSGVSCGALWSQTFTYDAFGNITKSGTGAFAPSYTFTVNNNSVFTNQYFSIPGVSVSYDANGNLLTDNVNTYTWDPNWGTMTTVSTGATTVTSTYDALGRMVENNAGGSYSEFVYGPSGVKLAKCNGQTLVKAFIALPGGAKAIYNSSGLASFRHSDWLGTSRLTSTATKPTSMYSSSAYAPFGEQYGTAGTADASFTGQDQDTIASLYDFPARRQSPSQGRWISPDPSGRTAVVLTNPQSWNRYAYVQNMPMNSTDPLGLHCAVDTGCDDGDNDDDDDDDDNNGCQYDSCVTASADPVQTQDSNVTCNTVAPNAPAGSGVSVNANIAATQQVYAIGQVVNAATGTNLGSAAAFSAWFSQVPPYGNWDYKQSWNQQCNGDQTCMDNNAYFGNFNFGATCEAIGLSQQACQRGAGAAAFGTATASVLGGGAWTAGPGNPIGSPAIVNGQPDYGDQPTWQENQAVIQGYNYAAQGCD